MRVLLMGYKHAGKSTLGQRLSDELGLRFVDMDEATEASYGQGKTVREIYQAEGGVFFRELEEKVIRNLLNEKDLILAGAPVHSLPTPLLREFEHRIFVQPSEETLLKRIQASGRPAFFDEELPFDEAFQRSYHSRLPAYLKAQTFSIHEEELGKAAQTVSAQIRRPKLAVPVREESSQQVVSSLESLGPAVDYAELWLDWVQDLDLPAIFSAAKHPLLLVVKDPSEHGRFQGNPEEKLALLQQGVHLGARFIDVDMRFPLIAELQSLSKENFCRLILSFHDFETTAPLSDLKEIVAKQRELGAGISKIAVTASNREDCLKLIELLLWARKQSIPLIGTAMGKDGRLSRLLGPYLGELGFACRDAGQASAPGQMTVSDLRQVFKLLGA